MAKSIWKRGMCMTRQEKKKLRAIMPHPNRGRALYRWKVENRELTTKMWKHFGTGQPLASPTPTTDELYDMYVEG
jgi:hypothetical protein